MTPAATEPGAGSRLRVLISAFSCIPGPSSGSEPAAGWLWSAAAAVHHDVWLLTWDGHRSQVDAALAERPGLPIRPIYVAQPRWLPGGPHDLRGLRLRYLLWQGKARRVARRAHRDIGFDLAHHVTLASDWMPPGVGGIAGLPLVWGPVGGYSRPAWRMARWLGTRWLLDELGRRLATGLFRLVFGRWAARAAVLVVAQNREVAARLRRLGSRRVEVEPNVALDGSPVGGLEDAAPPGAGGGPPGAGPTTGGSGGGAAVFAGRLVGWKGVPIALRALAEPGLAGWTLELYGDGPERERLERLRDRLGLGGRARFLGHQDRDVVRRAFARADVLVLPSLNDSAGWVIAEAALEGCPTVCLDRGGPPDLVAEGAGTAVRLGPELPARFASAMSESRRLVRPLERWSCDRLAGRVDQWYQLAVGRASSARADTTSA